MSLWSKFVIGLSIVAGLFMMVVATYTVIWPEYLRSLIPGGSDSITSKWEHMIGEGSMPFTGSAVITINGDQYLFVGGGEGQDDALLFPTADGFEDRIKMTGVHTTFGEYVEGSSISSTSATYGAAAFDLRGSGNMDLIVARQDGVVIYYAEPGNNFVPRQLLSSSDTTIPTSIAIGDYDRNNHLNIYIGQFRHPSLIKNFQFHNEENMTPNVMFESVGLDVHGYQTFDDITAKTNSSGRQNTFTASFIDLIGDGFPDLVLAQDTGEVEILINTQLEGSKGRVFEQMDMRAFGKGFWMGMAAFYPPNSPAPSLFFSNVGTTMMHMMVQGDRTPDDDIRFDHLLLEGTGPHCYRDVTRRKGITGIGFGWGALATDLDLDGSDDILFLQNYVKYPPHMLYRLPGVVLEKEGVKYERKNRMANKRYGQTPLLMKMNGGDDGPANSVVYVNMKGPVIGFPDNESKVRNENTFINVVLPETLKFANAIVEVTCSSGIVYRKQNIIGGIGFASDGSHIMTFGFGKNEPVSVKVIIGGKAYKKVTEGLPNTTLDIE